jgi:hypothetical protein
VRVVVPYEPEVHPLTQKAIDAYAPEAELVRLGDSRYAYWELLCRLWAGGDAFAIVEHDIEIHAEVMPVFRECPEPWCTFAYPGQFNSLATALGCVRFSKRLLAECPGLMENLDSHRGTHSALTHSWSALDSHVRDDLGRLRVPTHVHYPMVGHHHEYQ